MGRSDGTERDASGDTIEVQPTFILVGAPGTGKAKIADALARRFDNQLMVKMDAHTQLGYFALGTQADYRIELKLALARTLPKPLEMSTLFTHSLIDSAAYSTFALERFKQGTVSQETLDRAVFTFGIIGTILYDSFKYDHIFFLRGDFDDVQDYEQSALQALLLLVLDGLRVNYSIITADENATDQIGDIMEPYLTWKETN